MIDATSDDAPDPASDAPGSVARHLPGPSTADAARAHGFDALEERLRDLRRSVGAAADGSASHTPAHTPAPRASHRPEPAAPAPAPAAAPGTSAAPATSAAQPAPVAPGARPAAGARPRRGFGWDLALVGAGWVGLVVLLALALSRAS